MSTGTHPPVSTHLQVEVVDFESHREALYSVRNRVFVEEQGVPEAVEHDEADPLCCHVLARWDGEPVGTGRLTPEGRIGRMAVLPEHRRRSIGSALLAKLLEEAHRQGFRETQLAAQVTAITFYERFGFKAEGAIFQEAGIDHILMRREL